MTRVSTEMVVMLSVMVGGEHNVVSSDDVKRDIQNGGGTNYF